MINMKNCYIAKEDVAQFVDAIIPNSENDWLLTMTIQPEKSEVYCVHCVIGTSSEDIAKIKGLRSWYQRFLTWIGHTPAG